MNWHDYFTYDGATGNLIWKERALDSFSSASFGRAWNTRYAGAIAGSLTTDKRKGRRWRRSSIMVWINSQPRLAHLIIWEMHFGPIPEGKQIDHKDGDGWNNRISNLRTATHAENSRNCRPRGNACGYKGAYEHKQTGRFTSAIRTPTGRKYLGIFDTPEEAHAAYCKAAKELYGEFARTE